MASASAGSVELLDGQAKLSLGLLDVGGLDRLADLPALSPDVAAERAVLCPAFHILAKSFRGTLGIWHRWFLENCGVLL